VWLAFTVIALTFGCRASRNDARRDEPRAGDPPATQSDPRPTQRDPWATQPEPPAEDYASARGAFRTRLVRKSASPQPWSAMEKPPDVREIEIESGGHKLRAWLSTGPKGDAARAPAVLFLHGGFAFTADDWDMAKPFRDAGFVVMTPILRGENGSPGTFSLFYDEVDDVIAAADALAKQPGVDGSRVYVSGHSAGGALAMLAAMTSKRFRAAASLSGAPDATVFSDDTELVPFDPSDKNEFRMRSARSFATSFKCPARLYYGAEEHIFVVSSGETARRAKAAGLDVEAVQVPGDHFSMTTRAIPLAIAFFELQR
jgi:dipeptidyl aminopeptidase/acylaminoacyl peptidase